MLLPLLTPATARMQPDRVERNLACLSQRVHINRDYPINVVGCLRSCSLTDRRQTDAQAGGSGLTDDKDDYYWFYCDSSSSSSSFFTVREMEISSSELRLRFSLSLSRRSIWEAITNAI